MAGGERNSRSMEDYPMRTYDLTPFYRSTVGFDRLFSLLDQATSDGSPGYPPYNIERTGENAYRISVAVSGFAREELFLVVKNASLENGLLHVDLVREIPEAKKPRNIPIGSATAQPQVVDGSAEKAAA